ncbi:MAG TPA: hypothetical protein VFQ90_10450 [Stellaceae bacterium]|jgi:hypothetical protein|nr:hypothetical protein [Stellaceae bacterium]
MNENRPWRPAGMMMSAAMLFVLLGAAAEGAAQVTPTPSLNPYSDEMQHMQPADQAAKLAAHLGLGCIGTKPFFMGVTKTGKAKGYAYWSVTCAGENSYMIQISPDGKGAAVDCRMLKTQGEGRECYKSF